MCFVRVDMWVSERAAMQVQFKSAMLQTDMPSCANQIAKVPKQLVLTTATVYTCACH